MSLFSSGRGKRRVSTKALGTIQGQSKRSTSAHQPSGTGFGRADIGPGSKMQNKRQPRRARGMGY